MPKFSWLFSLPFISSLALADEVRIYTWEEYLSPEVIQQFETQFGHTVKLVYFENEQLRDEVIYSGRGEAYDLIISDSSTLKYLYKNKLIHNFSHNQIKNRSHINPSAAQQCGDGGIPYSWGTMGISYRTSQFDHAVDSWSDIFTPNSKHYGKITLPFDDVDTVAAALLSLRKDPFTDNENDLKNAYDLIQHLKPHVKSFRDTSSYTLEHRESSDIDIGITYSGETYFLNEYTGYNDWVYVTPKEGTLLWYECFTSVATHPPTEATLEFLNFINQPDIAAQNAEEMGVATTNQSALSLVSEEYLNDKELYPDPDVLEASFPYRSISLEGLKIRSRIMSTIDRD